MCSCLSTRTMCLHTASHIACPTNLSYGDHVERQWCSQPHSVGKLGKHQYFCDGRTLQARWHCAMRTSACNARFLSELPPTAEPLSHLWCMARRELHVLKFSLAMWNFGEAREKINLLAFAAMSRKKLCTLLDLCVSSLRRGHANLLCIVPILTDDPRRESRSPRARQEDPKRVQKLIIIASASCASAMFNPRI